MLIVLFRARLIQIAFYQVEWEIGQLVAMLKSQASEERCDVSNW
jgi:hypothetical protein